MSSRIRWRSCIVAALPAGAVATWVISPRFGIGGPSLIDDWYAISRSPGQVHDVHYFLSPDDSRFRPGWTFWNFLQWHTFGAPTNLIGPNAWELARVWLLVLGLAIFTALVLRSVGRASDLRLLALPALLVVTVPAFGVDLARFGPQEPILIGGMTLGGSLLFLASGELVRSTRGRKTRLAALLLIGYPLWCLGVYQKEASVSVVVLAAFAVVGYRDRLRRLLAELRRGERIQLAVLAALVAAPVVHVGLETLLIIHRGTLVYGAQLSSGGGEARKLAATFLGLAISLETPLGWLLLVVVLAEVCAGVARHEPDWLQLGLVATALVLMIWSAQTGVVASRYFMPTIALLAVAFSLSLARLQLKSRRVTVWTTALVLALSALTARNEARGWADDEHAGVALVDTVARLQASGCPVTMTGVDIERAHALPVLVDLGHRQRASCATRDVYIVRGSHHPDQALLGVCPPGGRFELGSWLHGSDTIHITRCTPVDPDASAILTRRRLR